MKTYPKELPNPFETLGNYWIAAWAIEEGCCCVQVRCPEIGHMVKQLVECRRVALGVEGGYLATYEVKRTLPWVGREIVEKILARFPKENGVPKSQPAPQPVLVEDRGADKEVSP